MSIGRLLRLLAGNLLVFLALLFVMNLIGLVAYVAEPRLRGLSSGEGAEDTRADEIDLVLRRSGDSRWELPNYPDKELAKLIFYDFRQTLGSQYRYEPFLGWSRLPFDGEVTTINSEGDRVHAPPPSTIPEGDRLVVRFFGGSTMWGTGAHDDGTIPASFNRLYPNLRVYNHGESGFNSRQGLERIINLVSLGEQMDVAISYDGVNEVITHCREGISLPGTHQEQEIREGMNRRTATASVSFRAAVREVLSTVFLEFTTHWLERLRRRFEVIEATDEDPREVILAGEAGYYYCSDDPQLAERVAEVMLRNWEIAHRTVADHGGRFVAILQPVAYLGSPRVDHLGTTLDQIAGMRRNYEVVYPLIRQKIQQRGHDWIYDFGDVLDGEEEFYIDFAHISPNGNEAVARRLSDRIGHLLDVGARATPGF